LYYACFYFNKKKIDVKGGARKNPGGKMDLMVQAKSSYNVRVKFDQQDGFWPWGG